MNKKIIILVLVTANCILELIFVFRNTQEGFTNYYRCEKRPLVEYTKKS